MHLAISALAGLGGSTAAGGTAAAVAGGTAAAAGTATASSTVLSILAGVATAGTVLGKLNAGFAKANESDDLASETIMDAGQQQLQSQQRASDLRRELLDVIGANQVAFAAAGIDVGGGMARRSRTTAAQDASRELSIERRDDEIRRARLKARAAGLVRQGQSLRIAAVVEAATDVAKAVAGMPG